MTVQLLSPGLQAAGEHSQLYTLAPILDDGPDVLDVHDVPGLENIKLCELELVYEDGLHRAAILRADNLLAPAAPRIPREARLVKASFEAKILNAASPHAVDISLADGLKLECREDESILNDWIVKRHFFISPASAA